MPAWRLSGGRGRGSRSNIRSDRLKVAVVTNGRVPINPAAKKAPPLRAMAPPGRARRSSGPHKKQGEKGGGAARWDGGQPGGAAGGRVPAALGGRHAVGGPRVVPRVRAAPPSPSPHSPLAPLPPSPPPPPPPPPFRPDFGCWRGDPERSLPRGAGEGGELVARLRRSPRLTCPAASPRPPRPPPSPPRPLRRPARYRPRLYAGTRALTTTPPIMNGA